MGSSVPARSLAELAAALCRPEVAARWRHAIPEHRSACGSTAISLTGQLTQYPHYALYTEFISDPSGEQEARVAPLVALNTLLSDAEVLLHTLAIEAGRRIRRLLDPSHAAARALRARFPQVEFDVERAGDLYDDVAGQHRVFAQLVGLARDAAQKDGMHKKPGSNGHHPVRPPPPRGGPWPPGIVVEPDPPDDEPAPPSGIDTPPTVIEIPEGSSLEPAMALRKWSAWTELQHQYLYWQWRTLNPREIAVIRAFRLRSGLGGWRFCSAGRRRVGGHLQRSPGLQNLASTSRDGGAAAGFRQDAASALSGDTIDRFRRHRAAREGALCSQ